VAAKGKGVHTGLLADSAPSWVERLNPDAVTDKDWLLRDQFLENLYDQQLRQDTNTQQWWQPGCFGCRSRTHIREDCPQVAAEETKGVAARTTGDLNTSHRT